MTNILVIVAVCVAGVLLGNAWWRLMERGSPTDAEIREREIRELEK